MTLRLKEVASGAVKVPAPDAPAKPPLAPKPGFESVGSIIERMFPRDVYDPAEARAHALSDPTLTSEQRRNLLAHADRAEKE
jgi:hypothetical protein